MSSIRINGILEIKPSASTRRNVQRNGELIGSKKVRRSQRTQQYLGYKLRQVRRHAVLQRLSPREQRKKKKERGVIAILVVLWRPGGGGGSPAEADAGMRA